MNILQVCPVSYGPAGGVSEHVVNISEQLAQRHKLKVYATTQDPQVSRRALINGVEVEKFHCYAPNNAYFFSWEMLLRLRKAKFDVIHGHSYHAFPFHFSTLGECEKFVVTPHFHGVGHTIFRNCLIRLLKYFGAKTLRKADKIVLVSEYEKTLISEQFELDPEKLVVIPNGVDLTQIPSPKKRNRKHRTVLYVGYLVDFKGVQYLIDVLPKLPDDVILEIVGRGPLRPFLERRARKLKVFGRLRFHQYLTRAELMQKYADAEVFVLLSKYEAYSMVVAEALAAGTPCIVADRSALSEWVDNESCFGVSYPVNLGDLARSINSVLNMKIDEKSFKKWIGTKILDWDDVAKRLEKIYVE